MANPETNGGSGWEPFLHHGMSEAECREAYLELWRSQFETDFRDWFVRDDIPLRLLAATIDKALAALAPRLDAMLPRLMASMELSTGSTVVH